MLKSILATVVLATITALTGCGTTGPLYIPEQRYPLPPQDEVQKAPVATPDNQPITE